MSAQYTPTEEKKLHIRWAHVAQMLFYETFPEITTKGFSVVLEKPSTYFAFNSRVVDAYLTAKVVKLDREDLDSIKAISEQELHGHVKVSKIHATLIVLFYRLLVGNRVGTNFSGAFCIERVVLQVFDWRRQGILKLRSGYEWLQQIIQVETWLATDRNEDCNPCNFWPETEALKKYMQLRFEERLNMMDIILKEEEAKKKEFFEKQCLNDVFVR